ncbi:nicotinamide riboside transporter PnuC [Gynuella sp.]|uniref:nicotinamide riboside transporter PnuC n=1 Tax=Gynuella sp. TaxID=2969146 RepID=UPI003D09CB8B
MSYLEFFGTICYLLSVLLIARRHMLTWPIGIISVVLYMMLFYQYQLYSDTLEQIYYIGASVYGWWYWQASQSSSQTKTPVIVGSKGNVLIWVLFTLVSSLAVGRIMSGIHLHLPKWFPEPASFPYLDALTTVMSFVAMWLMARRRLESWVYWIIVDVIGIWLYYTKGIKFVSLQYVLLLAIAIAGVVSWFSAYQQERKSKIMFI